MGKMKSFGIKGRRRTSRHSSTSKPAIIQINLARPTARRLLNPLLSPVLRLRPRRSADNS